MDNVLLIFSLLLFPTRFNWTLADKATPSSMKLSPLQIIKLPLRSAGAWSADNVEISREGSLISETCRISLNVLLVGWSAAPRWLNDAVSDSWWVVMFHLSRSVCVLQFTASGAPVHTYTSPTGSSPNVAVVAIAAWLYYQIMKLDYTRLFSNKTQNLISTRKFEFLDKIYYSNVAIVTKFLQSRKLKLLLSCILLA